jgi:hypothetical protein
MAALAITVTKPTGTQDTKIGNKRCLIRDITIDTGTYTTGGTLITAAEISAGGQPLKRIDFISFGTNGMTGGTDGATANPIGVRYTAGGRTATLQTYEAAATGLPLLEKTSAEATVANATYRVMVLGI